MKDSLKLNIRFRAVVDANGLLLREEPFALDIFSVQVKERFADSHKFRSDQVLAGLLVDQDRFVFDHTLLEAFVA